MNNIATHIIFPDMIIHNVTCFKQYAYEERRDDKSSLLVFDVSRLKFYLALKENTSTVLPA